MLTRPRFGFDADLIRAAIDYLQTIGLSVNPKEQGMDFTQDPTDEKFYNLAKTANAYLITGKKHFPNEGFILSPAGFLEYLK